MNKTEEIKRYQKNMGCSLQEAQRHVYREKFCEELRSDQCVGDLADTLIRILNFEFGGYDG